MFFRGSLAKLANLAPKHVRPALRELERLGEAEEVDPDLWRWRRPLIVEARKAVATGLTGALALVLFAVLLAGLWWLYDHQAKMAALTTAALLTVEVRKMVATALKDAVQYVLTLALIAGLLLALAGVLFTFFA